MQLDIDWTKVESIYKFAAMGRTAKAFLHKEHLLPYLRIEWVRGGSGGYVEYLSEVWGAPNWKESLTEHLPKRKLK